MSRTRASRSPQIRFRPSPRHVQPRSVSASGYSNYMVHDWLRHGGSPLEDINDNLHTLRVSARDLYMGGSGLATGALKTLRTNVVGPGLMLHCTPDARMLGISHEEASDWAYHTERRFSLWAGTTDCDVARQNTFVELQQLAMLAWPMSGDVFALLPVIPRPHSRYDLRIKLVEADRVCNPGAISLGGVNQQITRLSNGNIITQGVELDTTGEVVAYHVCSRHPLSNQYVTGNTPGWDRVAVRGASTGRRNILHLFNAERPEQYRGVPILAPIIAALKQLGRYIDTELIASVAGGMFAAFITSTEPGARGAVNPRTGKREAMELEPGMFVELNPNEHIETANPGRPNTAFDGFVVAVTRIIGAALEIPPEVLMKSFNASYSASRAALLEFWKMCKMFRAWLSRNFCQPIFEEWLCEDIARGYTDAPGFFDDPMRRQAWASSVWIGPPPGHIQPLQEVNAAEKRIALRISTRAQEAREYNGTDATQNIIENGFEEQMIAENSPQSAPVSAATPADDLDTDQRFVELEELLADDPAMLEHLQSIKHDFALNGQRGDI